MNKVVEKITKLFDSNDEMVITISNLGFVERTSLTEIHSLINGDVGIKTFFTRDNDYVKYISLATMQSVVLFFTSLGRCYWLKACDIPESNCNSNKYTVQNLLKIEAGDYIKAILPVKDYTNVDFLLSHYIVFCTKNGVVKRTCLMDHFRRYQNGIRPCSNGIRAIHFLEGDSLVNVVVTNGENDLMLASSKGRAIRFNEQQIRIMSRISSGVLGMRLNDEKDETVGIIHINDVKPETVMFVCDNGYGIRTKLEDFRSSYRGNLGLKAMNITNKTGKVVDIAMVTDDTDLIIFNKSGIINLIKVKDVPIKKRATSCVKLIETLPENDEIICVLKVEAFDKLEE